MCKPLFLSLLLLLCPILSLLPACQPAAPASGKPLVLCSIFAYYDAARAIAGDKLDVQILLPPSTSPHEYETTVSDKLRAAKTALFIQNGMGLDERFDKLFAGSDAKILTVSTQISKQLLLNADEISLDAPATGPAATAHDHDHAFLNPHIWLDPKIQIRAAEIIRDALIDLQPASKDAFTQNAAKYIGELEKMDADFKAQAAAFKNKDFIGFHSAYEYLARAYSLRQIASIEELPGSDITIDQTRKIIALIKEHNIRYIAVETAFSGNSAKLIQQETGAKQIVLQPLETYDDLHDTYAKYMRQNLDALKTALGN
jgi:zinc transport system substrate-binding protein